jgi:glycosyltransferase involved in cell wall biosynthesis
LTDELPLITTVIPTYNRPQLLRRAVKSVLGQTYPHVRVCVYADASGEDTMSALRSLAAEDSRLSFSRNDSRLGIAGNYRFGMQQVQTPYFSLLGDDDVLLPDFYQNALKGFQMHPEAAFSALATVVMYPRDRVAARGLQGWQEGLYLPPAGLQRMLELWPPQLIGVVFKRELIDQIGPLDAETGHALDLDYMYRVAGNFPILISLQSGALWVAHEGSSTVQGPLEGFWPGWVKMIRNLAEDARIPAEVRDFGGRVLTRRIKDLLYIDSGLRGIMTNRCEEVLRSAEILGGEFQEKKKAARLRRLAKIQTHFPPFGKLMSWALAARRGVRRICDAEYRKQGMCYLGYERYLHEC